VGVAREDGPPYDVFEVLSDGISIWKASIEDEADAIRKLDELAAGKSTEFRLSHRPTHGNHSHQKQSKELVSMFVHPEPNVRVAFKICDDRSTFRTLRKVFHESAGDAHVLESLAWLRLPVSP
jgi:hypothetical protein